MKHEAIDIQGNASAVNTYCDNLLAAYRELKGAVEEWAILVELGLATNLEFELFLAKSDELQDEMRENAEDLEWVIEFFRRSLEDSGIPC